VQAKYDCPLVSFFILFENRNGSSIAKRVDFKIFSTMKFEGELKENFLCQHFLIKTIPNLTQKEALQIIILHERLMRVWLRQCICICTTFVPNAILGAFGDRGIGR
jgi:hypothetical protein